MRFPIPFLVPLFILSLFPLSAEDPVIFRFVQKPGQVLHGESTVDETVYINSYFSHQAVISEFSLSSVIEADGEGTAVLDSIFRTVEEVSAYSGSWQWISSETVRLKRDSRGVMTVPAEAVRPVLRQVPVFPEYALSPGDTWSYPAEEVHVFRIDGVTYGPYRSTAQVSYRYEGKDTIGSLQCDRIHLEYDLYLPVRDRGEPVRLLTGHSTQNIYWDREAGRPLLKVEQFEFLLMMSNGRTHEFLGQTRTEYRLTDSLDREETTGLLRKELGDIPGLTVIPTGEGVLLTLEESGPVLFEPESALIGDPQKGKLTRLAESLRAYSDRDILITGHTADYGTAEGRKLLSLERAEAVGKFLFPGGRKGPGRLFLRGAGNSEPTGSDRSDRRVEILILD